MESENTNKKTTCNKKSIATVLPVPAAKVVAELTGVSESYVKKIRNGDREDKSDTAALVKYCDELMLDGQKVLVEAVAEIINAHNPADKSK